MKYTEKFKFRLDDMDRNGDLKNESVLRILESIAGYHSDSIGYGYGDMHEKMIGWVLLDWKIEVIARPRYGEELTVTTWGRNVQRFFCYRDYEIKDEKGNLCVRATSKWTILDLANQKLARLNDDFMDSYKPEEEKVFEEEIEKMHEPKSCLKKQEILVRRNEIDNNGHLHNTYYLNLAYEALPEEVFWNEPVNQIRITYKQQIKYGEPVLCLYTFENGKHIVTIKSKDESVLHSIIEMAE